MKAIGECSRGDQRRHTGLDSRYGAGIGFALPPDIIVAATIRAAPRDNFMGFVLSECDQR